VSVVKGSQGPTSAGHRSSGSWSVGVLVKAGTHRLPVRPGLAVVAPSVPAMLPMEAASSPESKEGSRPG
jgi:hypothetical protein